MFLMALFHVGVSLNPIGEHDMSGKAWLHLITLIRSELKYAKFQGPGFVQINGVNVINYACAYSAMTCQNVCCDKIESSNKVHKSIFNKPLQHLEPLSMTSSFAHLDNFSLCFFA